jgi:hypothetical protein
MRANTACGYCAAPVVRVFTENDLPLLIDPPANTAGYVYVVDHQPLGTVVRVVGTPDEVPGHVPLRYLPHICHLDVDRRVEHPRGGG